MKDYKRSHMEERIARQYEEVVYRAGSYDDMLWQWEQGILWRELDWLKKEIPNVSMLDFAAGTGRILAFLEDKVGLAVGIDNAEAMLARARACVKKAELICADITESDVLIGKQFDYITAFRFFLNAEPDLRDAAFQALVPKLRDERSVFIFNIHGNLWSHRLFSKLWYRMRGRRLNTMTVRQVRQLVRRHGLEVVRWCGFGVKPKIFYRIFGARFMFAIDSLLAQIPWMKYISYNLIFVCRRTHKTP